MGELFAALIFLLGAALMVAKNREKSLLISAGMYLGLLVFLCLEGAIYISWILIPVLVISELTFLKIELTERRKLSFKKRFSLTKSLGLVILIAVGFGLFTFFEDYTFPFIETEDLLQMQEYSGFIAVILLLINIVKKDKKCS